MSADELLEASFALVEKLGLPLAVAAWVTVFAAAVALGFVVRTFPRAALVVGLISLAAHLLDYFVTLHITPDLSAEANPIWRIVIDRGGLNIAKAYGLTGKILLSVISTQLYAWYLSHRGSLFPKSANTFGEFVKNLGTGAPRLGNIRSFFAFAFALFGPYFFYITFMNVVGEWNPSLYVKLPSPPVAIILYFSAVTASYFALMWRAFRAR
ncbi:MAG: hypothetical protein JNM17_34895 [Archangium sp.]|nr:hypothetical protein [Archangium sp.]